MIRGSEGLSCVACGEEIEVNSHVMVCPKYVDLRENKDLSKGDDLVEYFWRVMDRRMDI